MRKSFTRLLSLVMFLTLLSSVALAVVFRPQDDGLKKAYSKTTDKIMVIYPGDLIQAGSGTVRVSTSAGMVRVLSATDSRISYAKGDTVEIDLSADLKELTTYTVSFDDKAFKTVATSPVSKSAGEFSFTTGDYTAPVLKSVSPVSGSVLSPTKTGDDSNVTTKLELKFTDNSNVVKVGGGNITLYKADGNLWQIAKVSSSNLSGPDANNVYTLTISDVRKLEDFTNYVVTVDPGVVTDEGLRADNTSGTLVNKFAGITDRTVWTFSTGDYSAPKFASGYPKVGSISENSVTLLFKTKEVGKVYAILNATNTASASSITGSSLKVVTTVSNIDTEYSVTFSLADQGTTYYAHFLTENAEKIQGVDSEVVNVKCVSTDTYGPKLVVSTGSAVRYYKGGSLVASGTAINTSSYPTVNMATGISTPNGASPSLLVDQKTDKIVLKFDQNVKLGSGNVVFKKATDNSSYLSVPSSSLVVTLQDSTQVEIPVSGFENRASYYVTIPNTLLLDRYDNKFSGVATSANWAFTTSDVVSPTCSFSPTDGAVGVKKDAKITILFNEIVYPQEGVANFSNCLTISKYIPATNQTVTLRYTPWVHDYEFTAANDGNFTTLVIDPKADFESNAVVSVSIDNVVDIGNNQLQSSVRNGVSFVVKDETAPKLTLGTKTTGGVVTNAVSPTYFVSDVNPSDVIVASYDELVNLKGGGAITNANVSSLVTFKKTDANGSNVAFTASIDDAKQVITIVPSSALTSEQTYYVAITSEVEDAFGNAFSTSAQRSFTFKAKDTTSETVAFYYTDGSDLKGLNSSNVGTASVTTLTMKFKEGDSDANNDPRTQVFYTGAWQSYLSADDLKKVIIFKEGSASGSDVSFTVGGTASPSTFTITPSGVSGGKTYYLALGASTKDAAGNINVANSATFTTKNESKPTYVSLLPVIDEVQVVNSSNFVITFDTPVVRGSSTIYFETGSSSRTVTESEISISSDGKVVTIDPSSNLNKNARYQLVVPASAFLNKNKNSMGNDAIGNWFFNTTDDKVSVNSISPDEVSAVAVDQKLVISFNEKVTIGTGEIVIKNSNDAIFESIDVNSPQVALSDDQKTVTITTTSNFVYNTDYYVEVNSGAFKDVYNNLSSAIYGKSSGASSWTFKTDNPDLAIDIDDISPAVNSDHVAENAPIVVTFNREITAVAGTSSTTVGFYTGSSTTPQAYTLSSSNVVISGKTLTISHPDYPFAANSKISLYLAAGVLQSATDVNKKNAAVSNGSIYYFNTGNTRGPVATFSPKNFIDDEVYVPLGTDVTVTFDEDIFVPNTSSSVDANYLNNQGVFTFKKGIVNVPFVASISGKVVTLHPVDNLDSYTSYTVTLVANKLADADGLPNTVAKLVTFLTLDNQAPEIHGVPVNSDVTLTAGKEMFTFNGATITDATPFRFYYLVRVKSSDAAPTVAQIMAANAISYSEAASPKEFKNLLPSTEYQFFYVADDKFGNISDVSVKTVKTFDTVAPTLVTTDPIAGAIDVPSDGGTVTITLTFDENVLPAATGVVTVRDFATNGILKTYDPSSLVGSGGKSLKLVLSNLLNSTSGATKLYVEISKGIITDAAQPTPNSFDGVFGPSGIYFTTEDNQAPTVVKASSTSGNEVSVTSNINVVFSENVKAGSGRVALFKGNTTDARYAVQVFTGDEVVIDGKKVIINPLEDLDVDQTYTVQVLPDFVKDLSSNENSCGTASFTFTTTANHRLSVSVDPSGDNKVSISELSSGIEIQFENEDSNIFASVNGYDKALSLLSQDELRALITLKDVNGNLVDISSIVKTFPYFWTNRLPYLTVFVDKNKLNDLTSYTLTIKGFKESTGGVNEGLVMEDKVVTYNTTDATAPKITFAPAYNANSVDPLTTLKLAFSENVYASVVYDKEDKVFAYIDNSNIKTFVAVKDNSGNDVDFSATITGTVITITPTEKLKSGETYSYGLIKNVYDIDKNACNAASPFSSANEKNSWVKFKVIDYIAPAPKEESDLSKVFAPYGNKVAKNAKMTIIFSEDVTLSTGSIVIRREDGSIFQTVSGSDLSLNVLDRRTLTVKHNDFEANQAYFVDLTEGVVVDAAGNKNKAYSDAESGWIFTTADTFAVTVSSLTPLGDNTLGVVNLKVEFNKDVKLTNSGYINVYKSNGTAVYQIPVTTSNVVVVGKLVTLSAIALDANQSYYARIEPGTFKASNNDGVVFGGLLDNTWTFSTVNNSRPKVVGLTPADNSASVVLHNTVFTIAFDRSVVKGTGSIQLRKSSDGTILQSIDVTNTSVADKTVTFSFANDLPANTDLYILVQSGAFVNTEVTADPFAGIVDTYTWNFSTADDVTAPTLTVTDPVAPIAKVFTVGLTFSEPVTGVASGVTVTNGTAVVSGSGAQYTITVTSEEQKKVTIVLASTITDLATTPNAFAGQTLSYTTGDFTAPALVSSTPTGTITDNHPTFVVTFDENVVFGAGSLNIYKKSDNTLALTVPVTAGMISGKVATVTYTYDSATKNGLDQNTDYYVLVDKGFVKDVAGNAFAGITATTTWTFKTGDFATITDPDVNNSLVFKVYPNPFVDYVTVSNASELSKVVVSNIAGQVVKEVVYPDGTIQLNELHSGVYFVALYKDGKVVSTVKLLKR